MTKHCGSKVLSEHFCGGLQTGTGTAFLRQRIFQNWSCQWVADSKSNLIHSKDKLEFYSKGQVKRSSAAATKKGWRCKFWKCSMERRSYIFHKSVHVTLSKLIQVVYPEENNDLNQPWLESSNVLISCSEVSPWQGSWNTRRNSISNKYLVQMTNVVYSQSLGRDWGFRLVKNREWANWELVTALLSPSSPRELAPGDFPAIPGDKCCAQAPQLLDLVRFVLLWSLEGHPWEVTHSEMRAQKCRAWVALSILRQSVCLQNPGQQRLIRTQISGKKEVVSICVFSQDQTPAQSAGSDMGEIPPFMCGSCVCDTPGLNPKGRTWIEDVS